MRIAIIKKYLAQKSALLAAFQSQIQGIFTYFIQKKYCRHDFQQFHLYAKTVFL